MLDVAKFDQYFKIAEKNLQVNRKFGKIHLIESHLVRLNDRTGILSLLGRFLARNYERLFRKITLNRMTFGQIENPFQNKTIRTIR